MYQKGLICYENWHPREGGNDKREGEVNPLFFTEKNKEIQQL